MDMEEILCKMNLHCVYSYGVIIPYENDKDPYWGAHTHTDYVYLIESNNKYYVGITNNLKQRIGVHLSSNTNDIKTNHNSNVYILENWGITSDMRIMEYIWILWFSLNSECVNILRNSYQVRKGIIRNATLNNRLYESNYRCFCEFGYITGIKLLNKCNNGVPVPDEIEYFGRALNVRQDLNAI